MAAEPSIFSTLAAVSAASAFSTMCGPGALTRKRIVRPSTCAVTSVPSMSGAIATTCARPNVSTCAVRTARRGSIGLSAGSTAEPPGSNPSVIADFSAAMASSEPKWPICAASTLVMTATCGRTSFDSGLISPGWLVPISATQKAASGGSRARVSGTPQWLL